MYWLTLLVIVVTTVETSGDDLIPDWNDYKEMFEKSYTSTEEEDHRRTIWEINVNYIQEHNMEADKGLKSYRLGVNQFADMTEEEFLDQMTGIRTTHNEDMVDSPTHDSSLSVAPTEIDWRTKGYVTEVKHQGKCGSCYAFSALGSLEGQWFKKTGKLASLSAQNIVDCSTGNSGCKGGVVSYVYEYIRDNGGINDEDTYEYTAKKGKCAYNASNVAATVSGYVRIKYESETNLQNAVGTVGPVSVSMVVMFDFMFYKSGIYYNSKCTAWNLDHALVAVGYGTFDGTDYWLAKNSWGTNWGERGYVRMARNKNNHCGIATDALYPVV